MEECEKFIIELKKFSNEILDLGEPINDNRIKEFELKYNVNLPEDYNYIISKINGFSLMSDEVYGIYNVDLVGETLEKVYIYEHNEVYFPQFDYLVPFCPDGGGNFYCFDTRYRTNNNQSCSVIFWTSNYNYNDLDLPEIVYNSFIDCVQEIFIDWTIENYDYEGNEK